MSDVDMWASRDAGDGMSKHEERNLFGAQEVNEGNAFLTVGMKTNIHSLSVIKSPAIVDFRLSKRGCR